MLPGRIGRMLVHLSDFVTDYSVFLQKYR